MKNFITGCGAIGKGIELPSVEFSELPAKLSKSLWIGPQEMVESIQALELAEWAIAVSMKRRALPASGRRGRPALYRESSILVMALIQVAWQLSYEDVVDYLRSHRPTAEAIGFEQGQRHRRQSILATTTRLGHLPVLALLYRPRLAIDPTRRHPGPRCNFGCNYPASLV